MRSGLELGPGNGLCIDADGGWHSSSALFVPFHRPRDECFVKGPELVFLVR